MHSSTNGKYNSIVHGTRIWRIAFVASDPEENRWKKNIYLHGNAFFSSNTKSFPAVPFPFFVVVLFFITGIDLSVNVNVCCIFALQNCKSQQNIKEIILNIFMKKTLSNSTERSLPRCFIYINLLQSIY